MDFLKIQFEQTYTRQDFLQKPSDWSKLKLAKLDFYEPLLETVRELVKSQKKNSLILMTLYSPFMSAGQCATTPLLIQHLKENPEAVKKGFEILTESQLLFVRACIKEGIDGFYASTQGGEAQRFGNSTLFNNYIKPFDLVSMREMESTCPFNILHVCDYVDAYADYGAYYDYPGENIVRHDWTSSAQISLESAMRKPRKVVPITRGERNKAQVRSDLTAPVVTGVLWIPIAYASGPNSLFRTSLSGEQS